MDKKTMHEETPKIMLALSKWWESQGIDQGQAAYTMTWMAGSICGWMSNDEEHLEEGVAALVGIFKDAAKATFEMQRKSK